MTKNKRKILYIITQTEWGGAQKYVFDLATHLTEEFDITVATGTDGSSRELLDKLASAGIKNFTFKHLKRDISLWHDILAVLEIAKFLRQNDFDIVHLNSTKSGVIGALAAWWNRIQSKIIYTAHGWTFLEPLHFYKHWLYLMMEKISAQLRDYTIVLSEKEKQIALQYGTAKPNAISVIANGLDLANLQFFTKEEARQKLNLDQNQIIIGTIANLYKTKGLKYLLEATKELNAKLLIIGEGPERKNLEEKTKQEILTDKIILAGSIKEAANLLPAFDIFVLPSVKEGFPYTLLEAMAAGLPIIATNVGAITEILENQKTGLIVPPADLQTLAEAIASFIKNPEQARQLGASAKETVKKFDLAITVEKTKNIY